MSYTGVRRPNLFARAGLYVVAVLIAGVLWLFLFNNLQPSDVRSGGFPALVAGFAVSLVVSVVLHESGHLVIGLAGAEPVRRIRIGTGSTLLGFRVGGVTVQVCANPITGGAVYFSRISMVSGRMHLASLAAGPVANLIAVAYTLPLYESGVRWLGPFALANVVLFLASAFPSTAMQGGRQHPSDGMQIYNTLFRPPVPRGNYDGPEMTEEAYAVLAHAREDAQLAGRAEVTDEELLRALNQDPTIAAVFASAGLDRRIPPAAIPDSDELTTPRISKVVNAALTAGFQHSRDMGIPKTNPAALCLGLVVTECPAGHLVRESGITKETLTVLAAEVAEDGADLQRERVIGADLPLERWGKAADAALARARQIAVADRATFLGTQHLLAAVVGDPESRGARALERVGFRLVWKPDPLETDQPAHDPAPSLSPQAGLALAGGLRRTGPNSHMGTAEICLGILDQTVGLGAGILLSAGVSARDIEKALRVEPPEVTDAAWCTESSRGLWMLRGSARVGVERWLDARDDFLAAERAATTDLQRALCNNNIAWVLLMTGDPSYRSEALERSRAALAVLPDQIAFKATHAFAVLENGAPDEAARVIESLLEKQYRPRNRALDLCVLAMCQARLGRRDAAEKSLAEATQVNPKCQLLARATAEVESASALHLT